MSGNPLLRFQRDVHEGFEVMKTERRPMAPRAGRIPERAGKGGREERTVGAGVLPDRRFDVAASQRVCGCLLVAILFPPLFEMKVALSQEKESQRTFQGGNTRGEGDRPAGIEPATCGLRISDSPTSDKLTHKKPQRTRLLK